MNWAINGRELGVPESNTRMIIYVTTRTGKQCIYGWKTRGGCEPLVWDNHLHSISVGEDYAL